MTNHFTQRLREAFRRGPLHHGPAMPHSRLHGSTDIEDRDLARVLADLRVTPPRRAAREPVE